MGNVDLFGEPIIENELLRDKFLEPPFTILDGRGGAWQQRKKQWKNLGIKSELGRDAECVPASFGGELDANGLDKYGREPMSGTSIFCPALTELLLRWVCPQGGMVLDPFAGTGSTGEAAWREGFSAILIEREAAYCDDIRRRMALCLSGRSEKRRESLKARGAAAEIGRAHV